MHFKSEICSTDVLGHSDDFDSGDDIYDAVGAILHEVTGDNNDEEEIRTLCEQLMDIIKR